MQSRREFFKYAIAATAALRTSAYAAVAATRPQMSTRPIPSTGESLPVVGLGNAVAFQEGDLDLTQHLLTHLFDFGGAYVDTTGSSRYTVAKAVRALRAGEQLFAGTYAAATDPDDMLQELSNVLEAQGNDQPLDLVLTRKIDWYAENVDVYQALKRRGLTRYVGVARHMAQYHGTMMALMAANAVDFVQVNYSMLEPQAGERLLPMAQDEGVAILVNRPFVNGDYFRLVRGRELPAWAAEFDCDSWAQFSVKWILGHPAVNCVLTETSNPEHAVDNLGGGVGRLPDEKMRQRMSRLLHSFA